MSLSKIGVRSPLVKAGFAIGLSLVFFGRAEAQTTYRELCTMYNAEVKQWGSDTSRGQEMLNYKQQYCDGRSQGTWDHEVTTEAISPNLYSTDSNLQRAATGDIFETAATNQNLVNETKQQTDSLTATAGSNVGSYFDACKQNAGNVQATCKVLIGNSLSMSNDTYSSLMSAFSSTSDVANSCNQVNSYTTNANKALQEAEAKCEALKPQCMKSCEEGMQLARETGKLPTQNSEALKNYHTAAAICASMDQMITEKRNEVDVKYRNLQVSCKTAQQKPTTPVNNGSDDETSTASNNNSLSNGLNNALSALPALMGAMGTQTPPPYFGGVDTSTPQQYGSYTPTGLAPVVSNPSQGTSTADTLTGLGGGDMKLVGPPENYQKTRLNDVPQNQGGAGAMVGSNNSGGPVAANNKKKNGPRGGKLDKDINAGYLGGGAGPSARGFGGGYPDAPEGRGGGRGIPGPRGGAPSSLIAAMEKFRPTTWYGRRDVATVTGPDGITGPHTNLFRKVRIRYNEVPLGEVATLINRK